MKREPVYIIDAHNYIFRAYHGLPGNITAPSGMLTNAVLGYLRTLLRIIKERRPEYMAAARRVRKGGGPASGPRSTTDRPASPRAAIRSPSPRSSDPARAPGQVGRR